MCGLPGSGKSTWIKERIAKYGGVHVSRDAIRFEMLNEGDAYFTNEKQVFNKFVRLANEAIANPNVTDIYIDATHLNKASRHKITSALRMTKYNKLYIAVYFDVSPEICKARNAKRSGRALVPDSVIDNMSKNFTKPIYGFDEVWTIDFEGRRLD